MISCKESSYQGNTGQTYSLLSVAESIIAAVQANCTGVDRNASFWINVLPPVPSSDKEMIRQYCICTGTWAVAPQQKERHSWEWVGEQALNLRLCYLD